MSAWLLALCSTVLAVRLGNCAEAPFYYSHNGRNNNLQHAEWGSAGVEYVRHQVKTVSYDDGASSLAGGRTRPSAREVSLRLSLPSAASQSRDVSKLRCIVPCIGQFFADEIGLTELSSNDESPILVPKCDPQYDPSCSGNKSLPFKRSVFNTSTAQGQPRQQINSATAFVDGETIYGSSPEALRNLRKHSQGQLIEKTIEEVKALQRPGLVVNPSTLVFQILFTREHNRLAKEVFNSHPRWSDEQIFQEARKWNIGAMQSIFWHEYIPALDLHMGEYRGYRQEVNPTVDNFFSIVSQRHDHRNICLSNIYGNDGNEVGLSKNNRAYQPTDHPAGLDKLVQDMTERLADNSLHNFGAFMQENPVSNSTHLVADPFSRDVQRCRDHGFPDYNSVRQNLGLSSVASFGEITLDLYTQRLLESLYGNIDNVDPYVGAVYEDHTLNATFGPLIYRSLQEQYQRLRDGDRFYFENQANGIFTTDEILQLKQRHLRDVILSNTGLKSLPDDIFSFKDSHTPLLMETSDGDVSPAENEGLEIILKDDATLKHWVDGEDVHFVLRVPGIGWLGLGVEGPSGGMIEADIIVGYVQDDQAEVVDSWSTNFIPPGADVDSGGSNDATLHTFEEADGFTQIHFSRPILASDAQDRPINVGEDTNMIFAWHATSDTLTYHGPLSRGKVTITVIEETGGESASSSLGGSLELGDGAYKLVWEIVKSPGRKLLQDDQGLVRFTETVSGEGWIGLGLSGPAGGMIGADIMVSSMGPNGECLVGDYWSDSFVEPVQDIDKGGVNDIVDITCSRIDGVTEFSFSRPVEPTDSNDLKFNPNGITPIIFAWSGDSDSLAYHMVNRGTADAETLEISNEGGSSPDTSLVFAEAQLNDNFAVKWAHVGEDEIIIKLALQMDAWMGIGLEPEDGGMTNCDIYIGTFDGGTVQVGDYWATGYMQPNGDDAQGGTNDLLDFGGSQLDGVTEVWFRRKLDTGDELDRTIKDEPVDIIFAWGASPALAYHGPSQRATFLINLASAEASVGAVLDIGKRMIESHGGIMCLAWAGIGMFGVGIARFGRNWTYWLKAHRILQIGTTVVALIGEVIGFSYTRGSFRTAHSITALCVVFVTFPQVSLGAAAMRKSSNPNYNKLHRGTGYFLVGLALWQIWTGLLTLEVSDGLKHFYLAWVLALFIGFHFSTSVMNQKEVDVMLKESHGGDEKKRQRRRSSAKKNTSRMSRGAGALLGQVADLDADEEAQPDGEADDDDEFGATPRRRSSKKMSDLRNRSKSSKSSKELMDFLIEDESSDEGESSEDSSDSDAATNWSKTDAGDGPSDEPITSEDFLTAISENKKWAIIDDSIYDLEHYIDEHPGGPEVLENILGTDGTDAFLEVHGGDKRVMRVLENLQVGELVDQQGLLETQAETNRRSSLLNRARTSIVGALSGIPKPVNEIATDDSSKDLSDEPDLSPEYALPSFGMPSSSPHETEVAVPSVERSSIAPAAAKIATPSASRPKIPSAADAGPGPGLPGLDRKIWKLFPVVSVTELSSDVVIIRVKITGVPTVFLPVTSHIMIRGIDPSTEKAVTRSFTPLIPDQHEHPSLMDILIKCYVDGRMSRHIRTIKAGDNLEMKGPMQGLQYYSGKYERLGLIGGGSGITPLWQVVEGILHNEEDHTKICLIYQNRHESDILLRAEIDEMATLHSDQLKVVYVLSQPPEGWTGASGRVDRKMLKKHLPPAALPGSFVMVCGPPGMSKSLGGEFDIKIMAKGPGILSDLGFTKSTMHIFE